MGAINDSRIYEDSIESAEQKECMRTMKQKFDSKEASNTWSPVRLALDKNAMPFMMIINRRGDKQSSTGRFKTRPVDKQYVQSDDTVYLKTLIPVIPITMLLRPVGTFVGVTWLMHRSDILTSFLNDESNCKLYVNWKDKNSRVTNSL